MPRRSGAAILNSGRSGTSRSKLRRDSPQACRSNRGFAPGSPCSRHGTVIPVLSCRMGTSESIAEGYAGGRFMGMRSSRYWVLRRPFGKREYRGAIMTSTFRTLTVPLDGQQFAGGLPSFLVRDDVLCWTRREAGLVGFGEIGRFTATGPERFLEADIWWRHLVLEAEISDSVGLPGTGPVAF